MFPASRAHGLSWPNGDPAVGFLGVGSLVCSNGPISNARLLQVLTPVEEPKIEPEPTESPEIDSVESANPSLPLTEEEAPGDVLEAPAKQPKVKGKK